MSKNVLREMHSLEGRLVTVALRDGSRIDDCQLVSASRPGTQTVWLFMNGIDVFLPVAAILDLWEAPPATPPWRRRHTPAKWEDTYAYEAAS